MSRDAILHGAGLATAALVVLYVGFALGQHFEEHPEQRRGVRLLTLGIALLTAAMAWAYTVH